VRRRGRSTRTLAISILFSDDDSDLPRDHVAPSDNGGRRKGACLKRSAESPRISFRIVASGGRGASSERKTGSLCQPCRVGEGLYAAGWLAFIAWAWPVPDYRA